MAVALPAGAVWKGKPPPDPADPLGFGSLEDPPRKAGAMVIPKSAPVVAPPMMLALRSCFFFFLVLALVGTAAPIPPPMMAGIPMDPARPAAILPADMAKL